MAKKKRNETEEVKAVDQLFYEAEGQLELFPEEEEKEKKILRRLKRILNS